jgi:peptide subunit release factor 1 (eRF1)
VEDEAVRLEQDAPQREILEQTLEVFRAADLSEDQDQAQALVNEFRADGLACLGMSDTLDAVLEGRADEVLLRGPSPEITTEEVSEIGRATLTASSSEDDADTRDLGGKVADLLITHARRTGATLRFLEEETALAEGGGVGAFLRYRAS